LLTLYKAGNEDAFLRSFHFEVGLRPRYCELDALGHVSNTVYPAYLEFGRLQYFIAARDPEPGPFAFAHVTAELHLRYVAPCFYDEPLRVFSKLTHLGRSSAAMEQALVGANDSIRAISRVAIVRSDGERTEPWRDAQRAALEAFEGRKLQPC
jgi:acyl-CoA thioester hydrolase